MERSLPADLFGDDQDGALIEVFAEDYLHFHAPFLDGARSDSEAAMLREMLGLRAGDRALDLCCGHGRLTHRMAALGVQTHGLDMSAVFLDRARADAQAMASGALFLRGDAVATPYADGAFDGAFCWFTSFGLHEDWKNRAILAEARRVLRPGARFAIDLANRDLVIAGFQRFHVLERDEDLLVDSQEMDVITGRLWIDRRIRRGGAARRRRFFLRQFTPPEIADWMRAAGFKDIAFFGDGGAPFTPASAAMIVMGVRR